jgi:undecaprenyl-diphosphatase
MKHPASRRRTLLILGILLALTALSFLADDAVVALTRHQQQKAVAHWAQRISALGDWPILMAIGAVGLGVAAWRRHRRFTRLIGLMLIASTVAGVSADVIRAATGRARPDAKRAAGWYGPQLKNGWRFGHDLSSFPSAHTAAAMAFFAPLLFGAARRAGMKPSTQALAALAPVAVGWSRIYLSVHHLSDVFAGATLGLACAGWVANSHHVWHLRRKCAAMFKPSGSKANAAEAPVALAPDRPTDPKRSSPSS